MSLEESISSVRNCLAPAGFSANFQTTEQFVTWGTAITSAVPASGGLSLIFLATAGSPASAARRRLMALMLHEVLRATMAATLPAGFQLSCSGEPASSYSAL